MPLFLALETEGVREVREVMPLQGCSKKKIKSLVENLKFNKSWHFYLELRFIFSGASSDWIVVRHFSVLGVFPCGAAVGAQTVLLTTHSNHTSSCIYNARHTKKNKKKTVSYILIVDLLAVTLRRTALLWRLRRTPLALAWSGE